MLAGPARSDADTHAHGHVPPTGAHLSAVGAQALRAARAAYAHTHAHANADEHGHAHVDADCHVDRDTDAQRHVSTATPTLTATPDILQTRWLRSLVVEPGKTGRLWGITNEGYLMRSADLGATWETMPQPDLAGMPLRPSYVGMDYNHPATLYLGAIADGLWRSTDAGLSWEKRHPIFAGPVTVGLSDPSVLWIGTWDSAYRPLARSSDAGLTWASAGQGMSAQDNVISPILIDPQVRNVVYSLAMGPRGTATLYRSFDSIWEGIPAPINQPFGYASPGLMLDGAARDLYVGSPDRTLYASSNAYTPVRDDVTWRPVHTFDHQPIPLAVGAGPNGPALYITLSDHNGDGRAPGRTLRSDDGGRTWTLLTIPPPDLPSTSTPTPTPTRTAIAPTPTPTPTATPLTPPVTPAACYEGMLNGGFETTGSWVIRSNPVLAAYVKTPVQGGAASMRTGIPAGGANVSSYSPIEQAVAFPDGLASAKLSFWRYNVNGDVAAGAAQNASEEPQAIVPGAEQDLPALLNGQSLPRTEAEMVNAAPLAADFFYVIAIRSNGAIDWLFTESTSKPSWRQLTVDVSQYRGQTIRFQFGTYNNGTGGVSRTFVDTVSLQFCPPAGALVLRADGRSG